MTDQSKTRTIQYKFALLDTITLQINVSIVFICTILMTFYGDRLFMKMQKENLHDGVKIMYNFISKQCIYKL